jgi:hypothetical protein
VINYGSKVNVNVRRKMHCIMCHSNGNNPTYCNIIGKVGLITYDKDNETIFQ